MKVQYEQNEEMIINNLRTEDDKNDFPMILSPKKGEECTLLIEITDPALFEVAVCRCLLSKYNDTEQLGFRLKQISYHGDVSKAAEELSKKILQAVEEYRKKI